MKPTARPSRILFLDYLRAAACLMVICVHTCEFYYIGESDTISIRSASDALWVTAIDSLFRCAVPLFVMISAYLLVPLRESASDFFKRRFSRIVLPFAIWQVLYAVLPAVWGGIAPAEAGANLACALTNFAPGAGHLWFVFMLLGIYLFMPVISPWLERVSRRSELGFLTLWGLTTCWHYAREIVPGGLFGEAFWNEFHTFYYFSGYIGYVVLAHYIRTRIDWDLRRSLAIGLPAVAIGYAVTALTFHSRIPTAATLAELEIGWRFCSFNVALMSFGLFVIFKALKGSERSIAGRSAVGISRLSYGIYLMHIFVLGAVHAFIAPLIPTAAAIPLTALLTFALCTAAAALLVRLPGGRCLIG